MSEEDQKRYAAYLQQADQSGTEPDNPLQEVKRIRQQQLQVCDLNKRQEMAQMLKQTGQQESAEQGG